MSTLYYESSFAHHGVKGQKWGVRRYQNPDGTLNAAGKRHVAEWKENQLSRVYPKYGKDIFKNTVDKKTARFEKALASGDKKKAEKANAKLTEAEKNRFMDEGFRMFEASKIRKMTFADIEKENKYVHVEAAKYWTTAFLAGPLAAGTISSLSMPKDVSYVNFLSDDGRRTKSRITKDDAASINAKATSRAEEERRKRSNRINRMR